MILKILCFHTSSFSSVFALDFSVVKKSGIRLILKLFVYFSKWNIRVEWILDLKQKWKTFKSKEKKNLMKGVKKGKSIHHFKEQSEKQKWGENEKHKKSQHFSTFLIWLNKDEENKNVQSFKKRRRENKDLHKRKIIMYFKIQTHFFIKTYVDWLLSYIGIKSIKIRTGL